MSTESEVTDRLVLSQEDNYTLAKAFSVLQTQKQLDPGILICQEVRSSAAIQMGQGIASVVHLHDYSLLGVFLVVLYLH